MRQHWKDWLLILFTVAVACTCIGYFLGNRNTGGVYRISGSEENDPAQIASESKDNTEEDKFETEPAVSADESDTDASASPAEKINVNTADSEQLQTLYGIGETKAQAIIDYRTEHGDFTSKEQLTEVPGIGESTLEGIIDDITVN